MTTPLDIINGSLRTIGALASGEAADAMQANDAFVVLNDMLAQWSTERMMIHYVTEVVFNLTGGTYQYTIGPGGTVNASLTASQSGFTVTVTAVNSGAISINQTLSIGGTITSFGTGAGGSGARALGTYTTGTSQTVGSGAVTAYYQRPLRVNSGFTRVGGIDYPMRVLNYEDYKLVGLKSLGGPWPTAVYYQPSETLGNLTFWPNPSSGEVHLFCDTILGAFNTLSDTLQLPQGYNLALRYGLAAMLMPEYGVSDPAMMQMVGSLAAKAKGAIKRTNMQPQQVMHLDPMLTGGRANDAGWVLSGGF